MVDVQRNVVISLKLAGDPKNQTIADQFSRQAISAASQAEVAAKRTRDYYERSEKKTTQTKKSEADKRQEAALKEFEKQEKAAKEYAKKVKDTDRLRIESNQKANESALIAVQGMADMAEGMAKLGLVSEDNFQKFAKNFVMIQEGVRVFKGATDMFWKGREALIALSAATKAQTTYNELMSASNLKLAATNAAASASGAAGSAAGGAVAGKAGSGVVGNAVAGAVGAQAVKGGVLHGAKVFGVLAGKLAAAAAVALTLHDAVKWMAGGFSKAAADTDTMSGSLLGWHEASKAAAESTKKLTAAEVRRQKFIEARTMFEERQTAKSGFERDLRNVDNRIGSALGAVKGENPLAQNNRDTEAVRREYAAALRAVEEDKRLQKERFENGGHFASQANTLRVQKDLEAAAGRLLDSEVLRLKLIQDQNKTNAELLKTEKEKLHTLYEQQRIESKGLNEKLGELNPGLQKLTMGVAEKINSGKELNRRDINIMKEAGIGQEHIAKYYEKKGEKLKGSDGWKQAFGSKQTKADIAATQLKSSELTGIVNQGQLSESIAKTQISPAANQLRAATEARIKLEAEMKQVLLETIEGLKAGKGPLDNIKAIQQASAEASDNITRQAMETVNAIKQTQEATMKGFEEMKKQFEQFQLQQKNYK